MFSTVGIIMNMIKTIESRNNAIVQNTAALKYKKHRVQQGLFLLEGARAFEEAHRCPDNMVRFFIQQDCLEKYQHLLYPFENIEGYQVSEKVLDYMCSTTSPQGILAVMKTPETDFSTISKQGAFLLLDGVADPGNLGTIIRTAWAMDLQGIILVNHCADPFSPKTVRASMGGVLNIPVFELSQDEVMEIFETGCKIYGTSVKSSTSINQINFAAPVIIAIGNEAHGLSPWVHESCSDIFFIPMNPQVESMNVAVAAGIIMNKMWQDRNC